ncbi:MAG: Leucinerich repeat protein-like protein, partial [Flavipsychrobacter sp.]|nr:Leucinerich repeat protein-like protein [Flavipsychrobacter sp.]
SGDNGPATDASFDLIKGLLVDKTGNIYISDQNNFRVRKIDVAGIVTTIAGNGTAVYGGDGGPATAAGIPGPWGLCMDGSGNLYIADAGNSRIRKVNTSGIITTFAGTVPGDSGEGGAATAARISTPYGLAIDKFGSIYFSDLANQKVKKISSSGIITTIAGNGVAGYSGDGGPATSAEIHSPVGVAVDFQGNVFIADYDNNVIRKVSSKNLAIEPVNKSISGKEEVIIKPQPNEGDFVLHIKSEKSQPSNVYIINSIGEIITTMNTLTNMDINMHLKVPAGIYFVKTITANNTHTVQLSIK